MISPSRTPTVPLWVRALLGFGALLTLAAWVRFGFLGLVPPLLTNDSIDYLSIAEGLARGNIPFALAERRLPGVPAVLATLFWLGFSLEGVIRLQQLAGAFAAGLAGWMGWRLAGSWGALILGGFTAVHPAFLLFELQVMSELWSLLFFCTALALALKILRADAVSFQSSEGLAWGFGLLFAAAVLTRLDNLFPLALVAGTVVANRISHSLDANPNSRTVSILRQSFRQAGPLLLPCVLALLAWAAYLAVHLDRVTLFGNLQRGRVAALAVHNLLDPDRPRTARELPGYRREDPGSIFEALLLRFRRRPATGEAIAAAILDEQIGRSRWVSATAHAHSFWSFLGLSPQKDRYGCQTVRFWFESWLPAWPQASDLALRTRLKEKRSAETLRSSAQPYLAKLGRYGAIYLGSFRPGLVGLGLFAGAVLVWNRIRAGSLGDPEGSLGLAALVGHLCGALAHAWTLMDEDRYGLPYDIIWVVALLAAWREQETFRARLPWRIRTRFQGLGSASSRFT